MGNTAPTITDRSAILAKARVARRNAAARSIKTIEISAQNRLSRLDPTRRSAVAKRLAEMPPNHRLIYLQAVGGRSRKAAIKAFCLECVGWQGAEVDLCTARACPLYAYRPVTQRKMRHG